jgi:hypothetical protein
MAADKEPGPAVRKRLGRRLHPHVRQIGGGYAATAGQDCDNGAEQKPIEHGTIPTKAL